MSASESAVIFNTANRGRDAQCRTAQWTLRASTAAVVAKLRDLAPYAALELVLPGGSLIALLLWLYRRQKKVSFF
ncbi:MAG: hypothetical protein M3O41_02895 [Pseudomonadota bacterium]|nr:hypothetical protein [Pseudomonadota bacterium]